MGVNLLQLDCEAINNSFGPEDALQPLVDNDATVATLKGNNGKRKNIYTKIHGGLNTYFQSIEDSDVIYITDQTRC